MRYTLHLTLACFFSLTLTGCKFLEKITKDIYNTQVAVAAGLDSDTDAYGAGVEIQINRQVGPGEQLHRPHLSPKLGLSAANAGLNFVPGIFYGRGSQNFGDFDPITGDNLDYSVLEIGVRGQYAFPVNDDGSVSVYPLAGPAFYRFNYSDCPWEGGCAENIFLVDVGAGVSYNNFGLDVSTALGGPNFRLRLKYSFLSL